MNPFLILVDGLTVANRYAVSKAIAAKLPNCELYTCNDDIPPHLYVPMMADVWKGKHVVIDNGWRAHHVLGRIGQSTRFAPEYLRMLDRIALGCRAHIGLCMAGPNVLGARWKEIYGQALGTDNPVYPAKLVDDFCAAWQQEDTRGLHQQIIRTDDETFTDDIGNLLDHCELVARNPAGPGIGHWNPGKVVLLVGDRHGPSIQPYAVDYNIAFCDMAKAGSSYWLSQQLDQAAISEKHLYWINAYDKESVPTHPEFVERLKPLAVLAMGDSAARWCESNSIKYEHFSHPQYHKRFQFKEPFPLVTRLAELTKGA